MLDIIILAIVFVLLILALKPTLKYLSGKKGCSGNCDGCIQCGKCDVTAKEKQKASRHQNGKI